MAASTSSGNGSPPSRSSPKSQTLIVKVLEAAGLNAKASTLVEATTKVIDASDSPTWNENLEFSIGDSRWKVKLTLKDTSGSSLGVLTLATSDVDVGSKEANWFNMEDPSPTVRTSARLSLTVHLAHSDAIPKPSSNSKRSARPVSPSKPTLAQSNRRIDLGTALAPSKSDSSNELTNSGRRKPHKDKKEKHDKKEKKEATKDDSLKKEKKHRDKKEKLRNSADLTTTKKVTIAETPADSGRPRTLSDTKQPPPAASDEASASGPQRDAFLAPTLTQKFKNFGAGRASPLVHTWELDSTEVEFQDELGEGASAKVFKGAWRGQEVAIKVMKDRIEPKMLEDFKLEFNIMATIRSPNIVFFYGATLHPMLAIVLEFCHKGSLHDAMQAPSEAGSFTWQRSLKILEHALKGIICLHSWKPQIVHRDLKSMNLLVDDNWNVKVGDFGLSRFTGANEQQSTLGKMRGTYAYVAPEVYFGAAFTPKADIYSMAIIIWEVVVRTVTKEYTQPYAEYPQIIFPFQIVIQTAKNNLRPTIPETAPTTIASLIEQGWAKEPEKRPTAQEMLDQVRALGKEYEANKEAWDKLCAGPAASPVPPAASATTPPAAPASTPGAP